jgi:hypothetical protein
MQHHLRKWFWLEIALAAASLVVLVLTAVSRSWIEVLFGIDPDHGSGALESAILAALLCTTVGMGSLARREWRRAAVAAG